MRMILPSGSTAEEWPYRPEGMSGPGVDCSVARSRISLLDTALVPPVTITLPSGSSAQPE